MGDVVGKQAIRDIAEDEVPGLIRGGEKATRVVDVHATVRARLETHVTLGDLRDRRIDVDKIDLQIGNLRQQIATG